ncbi:MAG: MFS transporter [Kiritimatiellia bacterium]|nr:MFS transporter [Kiritimatiellia bacterium]
MISSDGPSSSIRCSPKTALLLLALLHFLVDFYGGLLTPLPQPTLTQHLGVDIGRVAALIGIAAVLANVVQPLSGWLLPSRGLPMLLVLAPLTAAAAVGIGLTRSFPLVAVLLGLSGIGIGLLHPEAALAAHSLGGRRVGAAVGFFMAMGYLGFASGGMVGGLWAHHWQLRYFWLLAAPAILGVGLAIRAGLHRMEGHISPLREEEPGRIPFAPVLAMAVSVATTMCLLVRFLTLFLVRRFPDAAAQAWGGSAVFATGITGAAGAFLWGMAADRHGAHRVLMALNLAGIPALFFFLKTPAIHWTPLWGLLLGATVGSAFPLVVVLARGARGLSQRLRIGLAIGGGWGLGEIAFILGGKYLGQFPATDPRPAEKVLALCSALMLCTALLAFLQRERYVNRKTA